jgi:hypothetical protein
MQETFPTQWDYEDHIMSSDKATRIKPVVHYRKAIKVTGNPWVSYTLEPVIGERLALYPIDHPNLELNEGVAYTSAVASFTEDGTVVTRNTVYVLAE